MKIWLSTWAWLCITLSSACLAQDGSDARAKARSGDGGFSVKLPCRATVFTMGPKQHGKGPVQNSFHLGCVGDGGWKFSATRVQYKKASPDGPSARSFFEDAARRAKWQSSQAEIVRSRFGNDPALDLSLKNSRQCARVRYVLADPDLFVLSVETSAKTCGGMADIAADYFATLEIDGRR